MFICTIIIVVANVRKYMNYTIVILPLGLYNLQVHLHSSCANVYYSL